MQRGAKDTRERKKEEKEREREEGKREGGKEKRINEWKMRGMGERGEKRNQSVMQAHNKSTIHKDIQ